MDQGGGGGAVAAGGEPDLLMVRTHEDANVTNTMTGHYSHRLTHTHRLA